MDKIIDHKEFIEAMINLPILICKVGEGGNFSWVNNKWEEVLGFDKDYITSVPFLDLIHPDDYTATRYVYEKGLSSIEGNEIVFANRYIKKDGNYVWILWFSEKETMVSGYSVAVSLEGFSEGLISYFNLSITTKLKTSAVNNLKKEISNLLINSSSDGRNT